MKLLQTLFLLFALSFGGTLFALQRDATSERNAGSVRMDIPTGESVQNIAASLKREGLIRSATLFRFYLTYRELDRNLRTGTFLFPRDATYAELAQILVEGEGTEIAITIPEGFTVAQIDALLAEKGVTQAGEVLTCARECDFSGFAFLPPPPSLGSAEVPARVQAGGRRAGDRFGSRLEGYLFPDTYFVSAPDFTAKAFLERLLGTFQQRVLAGLGQNFAASERSLQEVITMASLIERETKGDEERPMVSGILWKRFDSGRALDVDATIRYALGKVTEVLTRTDLEVDSPYNSRRHAGLPPGPIANPGLKSIQAALHPEDSRYWYYLHGDDGVIHYAETNDEHNENKARYL